MKDTPLYGLLRQDSIRTDKQLMAFSRYSCKYFLDTSRSTGSYIIFYQGGKIDHGTHAPGAVSKSSAEIYYSAACTAGMYLSHFSMLICEFLNENPDIFPYEAPLIIVDSKSDICMDNIVKDANHTRHIDRRVSFVSNGEKFKMHKIDWCEGGLQLVDIATKNFCYNKLNHIIKYIMLMLDD